MKKVTLIVVSVIALFAMSSCSSSENCPAFQGSIEMEQPVNS